MSRPICIEIVYLLVDIYSLHKWIRWHSAILITEISPHHWSEKELARDLLKSRARHETTLVAMTKKNLLLFENERVCREATIYTREYCLRMDLEVHLLMLLEMPFSQHPSLGYQRHVLSDLEKRVGKLLSSLSNEFLIKGIPVSAAFRVGELAQELLKFLAERPPFHMIIWGSDEVLPLQNVSKDTHWMAEMIETLECPLFAVHNKHQTH